MAKHSGLNHDEVAHRWAASIDGSDYGRGHSMFFEDGTIYSYGHHFPLARHITNDAGERSVLLTIDTYGTSTSKHCTITRRACHHLNVFDVPIITSRQNRHDINMANYQAVYEGVIDRAERCNVNSYAGIDYLMQAAQNILKAGNKYAAFFDLDDCVVPAFKVHLDWLIARYARLTSPEAKVERNRITRQKNAVALERWIAGDDIPLPRPVTPTLAEESLRQATLTTRHAVNIADYARGEFNGLASELRACMTDDQEEERRAFEVERDKEKITRWRAGEQFISFGYGTGTPCLLRLGKNKVETSWHASFPVEDAIRVFRFIQIIRKRGECYIPNGEQSPTLGHYKIDRIAADGTVRAGCHTVAWAEIEGIALALDLL